MNEMWGSYELGLVWGWVIAAYLFLAGLSSGAIMCALSVEWLKPLNPTHEKRTDKKPSKTPQSTRTWDAFVQAGVLIAPLAIIIGLALLGF